LVFEGTFTFTHMFLSFTFHRMVSQLTIFCLHFTARGVEDYYFLYLNIACIEIH